MDPVNRLMMRLGATVKEGRERFWETNDYVVRRSQRFNRPVVSLFFRTKGCRHDLAGGCTMCDYSVGPATSAEEMIGYVRQGLETIVDPVQQLLVSPSGSFLDKWEVPVSAQDGIVALMAQSPHDSFSFETRAETISAPRLSHIRSELGRELLIYIGLESADPWVSKYCVNKELAPDRFTQAVADAAAARCRVSANVIIGTPLLSEAEAIDDAVRTVKWARSNGAAECCLFPVHVKKWTQVSWLHSQALYRPPSLWALVEVLDRLGPEEISHHIELSWVTSYGAFNVIQSPDTCAVCRPLIIHLLERFSSSNDCTWIFQLVRHECRCKDQWRAELAAEKRTAVERVSSAYDRIGAFLHGDDHWRGMRDEVRTQLVADAPAWALSNIP